MFKLLVLALCIALVSAYKGYGGGGYGSIGLAVRSHHNIHAYKAPSYRYVKPVYVDVDGTGVPVYMNMKSRSSHLYVNQYHEGQGGSYQKSYSEDGPHVLKHYVKKPVYQEIHEVIAPYRKIRQHIKPVEESIETLVAKDGGYGHGYGGYGGYDEGYGGHDDYY